MLLIVYGDCTFRRLEDILPGNSSNRLGYLSENEEHAKIAIKEHTSRFGTVTF